jgi:hypothetical protein
MTATVKTTGKLNWRLTLRCVGAVAFGVFLTTAFSLGLAVYANFEEPEGMPVVSATTIPFPGSDEALKTITEKMLAQKIETEETQGLSDIAPAAGDKSPRHK